MRSTYRSFAMAPQPLYFLRHCDRGVSQTANVSAKSSEQVTPFGRLVELVGVIERMARLVAEIHQDLALVLEIVHLLLEARQLAICQIKRDADDRLPRRTTPLVCQ